MSAAPVDAQVDGRPPKPKWTPASIAVWAAVALVGAASWAMLAISRGEEVSAAWLIFAALAPYATAYRCYARFIQYKVLMPDHTRAPPAHGLNLRPDCLPTRPRALY